MSPQDQKLIFAPVPHGHRKIVIATNIAESSVTIQDVVYVVDCGRAKLKMFDCAQNADSLQVDWVSRANVVQRAGRAGRVRPGQVFKLYSKAREEMLAAHLPAEMLRCRLDSVVLRVLVLGHTDLALFLSSLPDPPPAAAVSLARRSLVQLGAVTESGTRLELTGLGATLGRLPLEPQLGRLLLLGTVLSCLDPVLSVVTSLDTKPAFTVTSRPGELARAVDSLAAETCSDHLAIANAVACWDGLSGGGGRAGRAAAAQFRQDHCLSSRVLAGMDRAKQQLVGELFKLGLTSNADPRNQQSNSNSACEVCLLALDHK